MPTRIAIVSARRTSGCLASEIFPEFGAALAEDADIHGTNAGVSRTALGKDDLSLCEVSASQAASLKFPIETRPPSCDVSYMTLSYAVPPSSCSLSARAADWRSGAPSIFLARSSR